MREKVNIVWLKRDLRLKDHLPLKSAIEQSARTLLVYIFEPSVIADPHYDIRHWRFVYQSLMDINTQLEKYKTKIYCFYDEVPTVFDHLTQLFDVRAVYSYMETGLKVTYDRDKVFSSYCQKHTIQWVEYQQNGVERGRRNRKDWSKAWHRFMELPLDDPDWSLFRPATYGLERLKERIPDEITINDDSFQIGGETLAWSYLHSFFGGRAKSYSYDISKPLNSRKSCSRLSPYIAWGNLSIRQVYQEYRKSVQVKPYKKALHNFASRLRWHCHFIQKFEMEDAMEFRNINRGFNSMDRYINEDHFNTWQYGQTGYPLVDACMRCLIQTGYINFRMRAMTLSFLTHHLWQDWKEGAVWLAQQFLDFEPGIHYPQVQMQAGVTGINTVRIYNPIKQSKENDRDGLFIKSYVPELANVPTENIHEPWLMTEMEQGFYNVRIGVDYPKPIIDLQEAGREARDKIWSMQKNPAVVEEAQRILKKHTTHNRKV